MAKATKDDVSKLSQLGSKETEYQFDSPRWQMLESFPNQYQNRNYKISHQTDEFTSLCPKTGQPDFASITIEYVADEVCVETKSLKLYLFAYRNQGTFMETIVNDIAAHLIEAIKPRSMLVTGAFGARGGVKTVVEVEYIKE